MATVIDWDAIKADLEAFRAIIAAQNPSAPVAAGDLLHVVEDLQIWALHQSEPTEDP
jgi:hypothetical protein